jgi:hypothetical protein
MSLCWQTNGYSHRIEQPYRADRNSNFQAFTKEMPNIPIEIFQRIQRAISDGRCVEAKLILHQFLPGLTRSDQLVQALSNVAESAEFRHDYINAEKYYVLAISLYECCIPEMHPEGLQCIRRYAEMLSKLEKTDQLESLLNRAAPLISRVTQQLRQA